MSETPFLYEQRSSEWFDVRRGKFTASEIHKLMGKSAGENLSGWPQTAQAYILNKCAQSISIQDQEIKSKEMTWGTELEPFAKAAYERVFKEKIKNIAWVPIPGLENEAGFSPDGYVENKLKGLEIKCPYSLSSHMESFLIFDQSDLKKQKPEYYWQIQFSLMGSGFKSWDFCSYHPYFDTRYQIISIEILRNEEDIRLLTDRLCLAIATKRNILKSIEL